MLWEGREQGRAGSSLSPRLMSSCQGWTLASVWQIVYCSLFLLWALAELPTGPAHPRVMGIPSPDGQPQCGVAACFWVCAESGLEGSQDSPSPWSPPHTVCCILCELCSL